MYRVRYSWKINTTDGGELLGGPVGTEQDAFRDYFKFIASEMAIDITPLLQRPIRLNQKPTFFNSLNMKKFVGKLSLFIAP